MGLRAWWKGEVKEDPYKDLVRDLMAQQKDQLDKQQELMLGLLDVQKDQNETTKLLLSQYLVTGKNESSNLDSRLLHKEEVEWDEVISNPFGGM